MELNLETVNEKTENKDFITAPVPDKLDGVQQRID